ncbi:hypothetical protein ACQKDA_00070 [Psychrobacter sp. NPDC078370]|uniref:hypothetical protein n=1 Tax=unclassified Psychrobacter TaxID=196806 RepID=UPI003CFD8E2B|tara:strand:- start:9484 stop:9921 length:438 start_codon:yes stop_codon:yes gene_type:complete
MAAIIDGLSDSQHILKISIGDAGTPLKVPLLTNIDMPDQKKSIDEITTTDARNTQKAVVDFTEVNDLAFELVWKPDDAQHIALKAAYDNNEVIQCEIHFADVAVSGYAFDGMISELSNVTDPKKKLRKKGVIVIGSDVTEITSAP